MLTRIIRKTMVIPIHVPTFVRLCFTLSMLAWISASAADISFDMASVKSLNLLVDEFDDEDVSRYIKEYIQHPQSAEEIITRGKIYFPLIEREISYRGLPAELKVLPFIESRFNPRAVSRVGAAGLWQFMRATAKQFGLNINNYVDERRDPLKATRAALSYLEFLYSKYGDWAIVFAAYNSGPGTVNKAIKCSGGKNTFAEIKEFLPRETQHYIPKYIAAQYIVTHHLKLGLNPVHPDLDLQWTRVVHLNNTMTIAEIATITNLPEEVIKDLNPSLKKNYVPKLNNGFDLVLPKRVAAAFASYLASRMEINGPELSYITIEVLVQRDQSVFDLARELVVDPYLFKSWNHFDSDVVNAGSTVIIHELYDPYEILSEKVIPMSFVRYQTPIEPLPQVFHFAHLIREKIRQEEKRWTESQHWEMHKASAVMR